MPKKKKKGAFFSERMQYLTLLITKENNIISPTYSSSWLITKALYKNGPFFFRDKNGKWNEKTLEKIEREI